MKSILLMSSAAAAVLVFSACDAKDERNLQSSVEKKTDRLEYEDRGLTGGAPASRVGPDQPAAAKPAQSASSSETERLGVGPEKSRNAEEK